MAPADRRRAAAGLAQARLDALSRLIEDCIWETDADLRLSSLSPRVFDILGRHPDELRGRPLEALGEPVSLAIPSGGGRLRLPFRDVLFRMADRAGRERLCAVSALPLYAPDDGAFAGMVGLLRDVTGQPWAEEEIGRLLHAVDGHIVLVAMVAADGRIGYANRRLGEVLGFGPAALVGRVFDEVAVPAGAGERRLVGEADAPLPVAATAVPLHDPAGRGVLWVLCDTVVTGLYGDGASPSFTETVAGIAAVVGVALSTVGIAGLQAAGGELPRPVAPAWLRPGFTVSDDAPQLRFSGRQQDVFALLMAGKSNKEIARALGISTTTVKTHIKAIYEKLGVDNRKQAAALLVRLG